MTINEYQALAMRTLNPALDGKDVLINGVMGLCGEAGEAIDIVKKHLAQGHPLDREALLKELGDVAWYLAETAHALGADLESVLAGNIEKLRRRYPEGFDAVVVRPGNHTGPGQSPQFAAPSFARQVLAAKRGEISAIRVGNLDSVRSFADVRDIVRAYRLLLERGVSGGVYNAASPANVRVGEVLDRLRALAGCDAPVETDPALWRPTDACPELDVSRLRADTGWAPAFSLDDTLRDLLAEPEPTTPTPQPKP